MAVIVEKWIDKPVIVLKPDTHVSEQELIDAWFRSAQLAHENSHRIVDLSVTESPDEVVSMLRNIVQAGVGAPVSPQLEVIFVGASPTPGSGETWFATLNAAVESIMETKSTIQVKVS